MNYKHRMISKKQRIKAVTKSILIAIPAWILLAILVAIFIDEYTSIHLFLVALFPVLIMRYIYQRNTTEAESEKHV